MEELVYPALARPRLASRWDAVGVIDDAGPGTVGEHIECAWRLVSALRRDLGHSVDDRFAVFARSSGTYFDLWQAAAWGAGTLCPVNTRLSADEAEHVVRDCAPRVVFVDAAHADLLDELRRRYPELGTVVALDPGVDGADLTLAELLSAGDPEPPPDPDQHDPMLLMYTGGTSGRPKGVLHDQLGVCLALHRTHALYRVADPDARVYQTSPLFHIMASAATLAAPAGGGLVVLRESFDIATMLTDIAQHGLTHVAMVPTMFSMLLEHPRFDPALLASLRFVIYGGAPVAPAVLERLLEQLPAVEFVQAYGMTEACGGLTGLLGADHREKRALDSVGRPLLGVELEVQAEDGTALAPGEVGEVCARCGSIMRGYRDDPERTAQALRGGWYHTGDLGTLDRDGYLRIVDRVDDMIVTGGENVYSSEVEQVLAEHPDVVQVAVVGLPDDRWGQAVHAVVVLRVGATVDEAEVAAFARTRIAGYKVPKSFEITREPLPLSGVGKVQKHLLRMRQFDRSTG